MARTTINQVNDNQDDWERDLLGFRRKAKLPELEIPKPPKQWGPQGAQHPKPRKHARTAAQKRRDGSISWRGLRHDREDHQEVLDANARTNLAITVGVYEQELDRDHRKMIDRGYFGLSKLDRTEPLADWEIEWLNSRLIDEEVLVPVVESSLPRCGYCRQEYSMPYRDHELLCSWGVFDEQFEYDYIVEPLDDNSYGWMPRIHCQDEKELLAETFGGWGYCIV